MIQNNGMHLNNGNFAYDGFFRYSDASLYLLLNLPKCLAFDFLVKFHLLDKLRPIFGKSECLGVKVVLIGKL